MKTLVIPDINVLEFLIRKIRNETMITLQNYTSEEIDLFSIHSIIKSGDFYNMRLPRLQILPASFSLQAKFI